MSRNRSSSPKKNHHIVHNNNQQNTPSIRQVHYPNTKPSITIAYNQITPT